MAVKLAARLAQHPEDFETVAGEFSDDVVTRQAGGSLGGLSATDLPPVYLDALSVIREGEVSRVLPSALGFAIVLRRSPPADAEVAGKRLLIFHRDSPALPEGTKVERTREEALVDAQTIVKRLRQGEATFDELLAKTDGSPSVRPGDMGQWKTRAPLNLPRQIEALSRLRVGGISDPIETVFGFEVLQRTETMPRRQYAMRSIRIRADKNSNDEVGSTDAAALAESVAAQLRHHPESFDVLLNKYCCREPARWSHGRGPDVFEPVLDGLAVGEIARAPIRFERSYHILMRLDPSAIADDEMEQYELPAPSAASLPPMVKYGEGKALAARTRELAKDVVAAMPVTASQSVELSRLFEELAISFETHPGFDEGRVRVESLEAKQTAFLQLLGPAQYRLLADTMDDWISRQLLSGAP